MKKREAAEKTGQQMDRIRGREKTVKKTAIIDIDNTLWPFSDAFYLELRKVHPAFPHPDQWRRYDPWEGTCSYETFRAAIERIHLDQDNKSHRPYPEAPGFLHSLKDKGFYLVIASHRTEATRQSTENWLRTHGLTYDELHLSFDKTVLFPEARVLVDDSPLTLKKAVEQGLLSTGLRFPWNSDGADNGIKLFNNLKEVRDYILGTPL